MIGFNWHKLLLYVFRIVRSDIAVTFGFEFEGIFEQTLRAAAVPALAKPQ